MQSASDARAALAGLTSLATDQLAEAFDILDGLSAEDTREALVAVLAELGDAYGLAAGTLAADWYDDLREEAEAPRRFLAEPAEMVTEDRWASLAGFGVAPLFRAVPDRPSALTLLQGGLQRTVADRHRLTIVENSLRDPSAAGWGRVGVGDNCGFCRLLIDRGHVYTESSVTFRSHDWCNCAASPSFADNVVRVSREPFRQSQRRRSEATKRADNARAREAIAAN